MYQVETSNHVATLEAVSIERTRDVGYVNSIVRTPSVWEHVTDDASPPKEQFTFAPMIKSTNNVFLRVEVYGEPAGFFVFLLKQPKTSKTYQMHTNLLANCHGAKALEAGWMAVAWLFENTNAQTIETHVFSSAIPARMMMRWAQWPEVSREPHQNTVNGEKVDRILYRFTRTNWNNRNQPLTK